MSTKMDKWVVLVGCCVRLIFVSGCLKSNGVLLEDIVSQLKTTNSIVAWAFSLQHSLSFFMAPFTGIIIRVAGKRQTAICGGLLVGLGYIYFGLYLRTVWQLFMVYILTGIGQGLMSLPAYVLVKDHFQDEFPTAISFVTIFGYIGMALLPPLLQWLRNKFGERMAFVLFGTLLLNLVPCGVAFRESRNIDDKVRHVSTQQLRRDENQETAIPCGIFDKYFAWCNSLFRHPMLTLFCLLESIAFSLYVSWALFLVSLGTSSGLTTDQAVLLSTCGGIGGLIGTVASVMMFYYGIMSPVSGCLVPFLLNGLSLSFCVVFKSCYLLMTLTFLSGICFGVTINAFFGLLPSVVCNDHFRQSLVISYIFDGTGFQLGALTSGGTEDLFGSAKFVFLLDALLSFLCVPLTLFWVCTNKKPKECAMKESRKIRK